uniref:Zinc finger protein 706 n=1 Tax=Xenopus tropicalis TaxID=8364 RepID=F6USR9_XENTR
TLCKRNISYKLDPLLGQCCGASKDTRAQPYQAHHAYKRSLPYKLPNKNGSGSDELRHHLDLPLAQLCTNTKTPPPESALSVSLVIGSHTAQAPKASCGRGICFFWRKSRIQLISRSALLSLTTGSAGCLATCASVGSPASRDCRVRDMARGHQKIQSQQKNLKKQAEQKKKQGHDQKAAAKAALVFTCSVCRTQMPDPKTFKQHFESKHPKSPLPPELVGVEA